jgi:hypothetical protein
MSKYAVGSSSKPAGASERDRPGVDGRVDVAVGLRARTRVLGVGLRVRVRVGVQNEILDRKVGLARLVGTPLARGGALAFKLTLEAPKHCKGLVSGCSCAERNSSTHPSLAPAISLTGLSSSAPLALGDLRRRLVGEGKLHGRRLGSHGVGMGLEDWRHPV